MLGEKWQKKSLEIKFLEFKRLASNPFIKLDQIWKHMKILLASLVGIASTVSVSIDQQLNQDFVDDFLMSDFYSQFVETQGG